MKEELEKELKNLDILIGNAKSDLVFAVDEAKKIAIKKEIKRLEILKKQIRTGNFGKIPNPMELRIKPDAGRCCLDYRTYDLYTMYCFSSIDILRCIICNNSDFSILDKDGNVLKEFISVQPDYKTFTIFFDGEAPKNLYRYIKDANYTVDAEGEKKLIYRKKG